MWYIIIGVIILLLIIGASGNSATKEVNEKLLAAGYDPEQQIILSKYLGGHPDINEAKPHTSLFYHSGSVHIMEYMPLKMPIKLAEIPGANVKNVVVEDQSSVERRVTLGRMLLVGIFAFAWKKKKKNEQAYLIFEWSDGRFEHETIFEFEGRDAMVKANTARNGVIKWLR
jgi:hypothetical protein